MCLTSISQIDATTTGFSFLDTKVAFLSGAGDLTALEVPSLTKSSLVSKDVFVSIEMVISLTNLLNTFPSLLDKRTKFISNVFLVQIAKILILTLKERCLLFHGTFD